MFIKLSIGIFLLRLSSKKFFVRTVQASLVVILLWSLGSFLWDIFQCTPVPAQWDYTIPHGKCVSSDEVVMAAYALSIMTIVTDWLFVRYLGDAPHSILAESSHIC